VSRWTRDVSSFPTHSWNRPETQSRTSEPAGSHNRRKRQSDAPNNGFSDFAIHYAVRPLRFGSFLASKIESWALPVCSRDAFRRRPYLTLCGSKAKKTSRHRIVFSYHCRIMQRYHDGGRRQNRRSLDFSAVPRFQFHVLLSRRPRACHGSSVTAIEVCPGEPVLVGKKSPYCVMFSSTRSCKLYVTKSGKTAR
jgi:hypothetical protein